MSYEISIKRKTTSKGGRYIATVEGYEGKGRMDYTQHGANHISLDHTIVDPGLKGLGVGGALASRVVADARADGVTVDPICPYFLAPAKKHPEWHDVVIMPKKEV